MIPEHLTGRDMVQLLRAGIQIPFSLFLFHFWQTLFYCLTYGVFYHIRFTFLSWYFIWQIYIQHWNMYYLYLLQIHWRVSLPDSNCPLNRKIALKQYTSFAYLGHSRTYVHTPCKVLPCSYASNWCSLDLEPLDKLST